jgi:voltage-gated potassium channel
MAKIGNLNIEDFKKVERKIGVLIFMFVSIIVLGTVAFVVLENESITTAVYSTVWSAIGHGFAYSNKLTELIAFLILIVEWATLWMSFDVIVEFISEGKVREMIGGLRMKKKIEGLKDHYILCGYGRVGEEIAKELRVQKKEVVIIDSDPASARNAVSKGFMVLEGDVLQEDAIKSAGIERARVLITAMRSPSDNVFVTLTAKQLNPHIKIIARADQRETLKKLKQAGATEVILPSVIGGKAMADAATKS